MHTETIQPGDNIDYENDILTRYKNGEFFSQDSIKHKRTKPITLITGALFTGGGGITPDNIRA